MVRGTRASEALRADARPWPVTEESHLDMCMGLSVVTPGEGAWYNGGGACDREIRVLAGRRGWPQDGARG